MSSLNLSYNAAVADAMGLARTELEKLVDSFVASHKPFSPSRPDVAAFLSTFKGDDRNAAAQLLLAAGVDAFDVEGALRDVKPISNTAIVWSILATASAAASAYHGYRRNQSVGWAIGWFLLGSFFPVITPAVAFAQGFGKRKGSS